MKQKVLPKKQECKYDKKCGSCDYINMPYDRQLEIKQKKCEDLLGKFIKPDKIVASENPYNYRNKIHASFGYEKGKIIAGSYAKNTHKIIDIAECRIEDEIAAGIIRSIKDLCKAFKIKTYNEDTGYGFLRHILIRVGKSTGELMLVLITGSVIFPGKNNFIKSLRTLHPEISTIIQNINPHKTSMVLGERENILYGKGYIEDILCGLKFRISSKSFYQVNPLQTEKLYNYALEKARLNKDQILFDAYCGVGTIGLIAANRVKKVISVELNKEAVKDAIANAKVNSIKNIDFYANDAGDFIESMVEEKAHIDTLIMDPPRSGSTDKFIAAVAKLSPKNVVYISCNPETLARDLHVFKKKGYKVENIRPFDCFPMTEHVEAVCLLSKLSI